MKYLSSSGLSGVNGKKYLCKSKNFFCEVWFMNSLSENDCLWKDFSNLISLYFKQTTLKSCTDITSNPKP